MAKASGVLKIEGSVEDLTFYKLNGKNFVRRKGTIAPSRIANDPNFVRTRENNREFSSAADTGKLFREASGSFIYNAKDNKLSSRMLGTMFQVKKLDSTSERGKRNVANGITTPEGKMALQGFDFNINAPLGKVLHHDYMLDTTNGKFVIAGLIPKNEISKPEGADVAVFQTAVLGIDLNTGLYDLKTSTELPIQLESTLEDVALSPSSMPTITNLTLFLLKITFYQKVNGQLYALKNKEYNVCNILEVI